MLDAIDTWSAICDTFELLESEGKYVSKLGRDYASAERDYRAALAAEILRLRGEGMPVTITPDVARGNREVSLLRFKRDCAETEYKSSLEAINIYKTELRILEAQHQREWSS